MKWIKLTEVRQIEINEVITGCIAHKYRIIDYTIDVMRTSQTWPSETNYTVISKYMLGGQQQANLQFMYEADKYFRV